MGRELSGLYFRSQEEDGTVVTKCWEELSETQRFAILASNDEAFKDRLISRLTDTINEIGEAYDAYREQEVEEED